MIKYLQDSKVSCIFALSNQNNKVMKIRKRLSDFPQKLKIFKAVEKGCSTIEFVGEVNHKAANGTDSKTLIRLLQKFQT